MVKVKKKKRRLKGSIMFVLLLFVIGFGYWFYKDYTSNERKLERIGYNEAEINILVNNKADLDYALSHNYNESLIKLIETKDYNNANLEKYLEYKNNNASAPIEDIIYLVNHNINKSYSKTLMSLIGYKYFIEDYLERYLSYAESNPSKEIKDIVTNVNSNIDHSFYTDIKNVDLSKDNLMLVNKYHQLSNDYKGKDLVTISNTYSRVSGAQLNKDTYEAFKKLVDEAKKSGLYIVNVSAYRSFDTQNNLYNNYKANNGLVWADSYSARAGHSEHQTGLALDVGSNSTTSLGAFENTEEFKWMKVNAHKYGFILRYPKDKEYITGYNYEPWHYRYVGIEVATYIYENDITFEEYYAFFVK